MSFNPNNLIVTMAVELLAEEEAERTAKWLEFVKRTEPQEDKFKPPLRAFFTKQEKAVLARLRATPVPSIEKSSDEAIAAAEAYVDAIYTAAQWQKILETMMLPLITLAYKKAGQEAFIEIGLEATFNVTNPRARKFLKDRTFKNVKGINDETREKLRRALIKGLDAGEGIPDISKRIASVFDINRGSRTDKIARTEIVGASNNGTHHGYVESEIVITKIWIDSRDSRVRTSPHNHALDGEERKLKSRFSNGLLHPHDPGGAAGNVIQCRCTIASGKLKEAA